MTACDTIDLLAKETVDFISLTSWPLTFRTLTQWGMIIS